MPADVNKAATRQVTVATPGTPQRLASATTPAEQRYARTVLIKAHNTNSAAVYISSASGSMSTTGYFLQAGDTVTLTDHGKPWDMYELWVDAVSGSSRVSVLWAKDSAAT